jgi:hypothetical protein
VSKACIKEKRMIRMLAAVGIVLLGLGVGSRPAQAQDAAGIRVTPLAGTLSTTFLFTGSGFVPGTQFQEIFTDAAGQQYVASSQGQDLIVVADNTGSFQISLNPATDVPASATRTWLVSFCVIGDTSCYAGDTIDIVP